MLEGFGLGMAGAFLLDLVRWAERLRKGKVPQTRAGWIRHLVASLLILIVGGGTAMLFVGSVEKRYILAALGCGAPGVLRTMATWVPRLVQRLLRFTEGDDIVRYSEPPSRSEPGWIEKMLEAARLESWANSFKW